MNTQNVPADFEYPDAAGYPDGSGFLDEGTNTRQHSENADTVPDSVPSIQTHSELRVRRDDNRQIYMATIDGREVARIRYDTVDGRIVIVSTSVQPEFRGRGIANELISYALNDIRRLGMHVTVYCPTVARFIAENQQFSDLLDPEYPGR